MRFYSLIQLAILLLVALQGTRCPRNAERLAASQLQHMAARVQSYRADCGSYPVGLQDLVRSHGCGTWLGPYVRTSALADPWKHPIRYATAPLGLGFAVCTLGADGRSGGNGNNVDACVLNLGGESLASRADT